MLKRFNESKWENKDTNIEGLCTQFSQQVFLSFCFLLKKLSLEIIKDVALVRFMQES